MKIQARYVQSGGETCPLIDCARDLYRKSRRESASLLGNSRKKAASEMQRKRNAGFKLGYEDGFEKGSRESSNSAVRRLFDYQVKFSNALNTVKRECLDLAIRIAEEIVESELICNRSSLSHKIEKVISQISQSRAPVIIVSGEDKRIIEEALTCDFCSQKPRIVESNALQRGNAIIRSAAGDIEINWKHHLSLIRDVLTNSSVSVGDFSDISACTGSEDSEKPFLVAVK